MMENRFLDVENAIWATLLDVGLAPIRDFPLSSLGINSNLWIKARL